MNQSEKKVAVVIGVGPADGLGGTLCLRFAQLGLHVVASGRTQETLDTLVEQIVKEGGEATAVAADTTDPDAVRALWDAAEKIGKVDLAIYNAGNNWPIPFTELKLKTVESFWRVSCFGGFVFAREAIDRMLPAERGKLFFTGASASMRGRPQFAHFSAAKAGLRMLAQSLAREFGPQGIHVAHVVVDGGIHGKRLKELVPQFIESRGEDGMIDLQGLADIYQMLYQQPRAAWSHEVDVRPYKETF